MPRLMMDVAATVTLILLLLLSFQQQASAQSTFPVLAANATSSCTLAMRNSLNPLTGLPYCIKVALLRDGASSSPYYTNTLPQKVFNEALLDIQNVTVEIFASDLIWEEGIEAVYQGEFDVFVANIWILRRRVRNVDFSSPFLLETLGLLYEKPVRSESRVLSFLEPLHWGLWLGVVVTMLLGSLLFAVTELCHESAAHTASGGVAEDYFTNNELADRRKPFVTLKKCFFHSINIPFGTMEHTPKSGAGKLLQWQIGFFFLIVLATYTANLASFLTVTQASQTISKEKLLEDAVMAGPGDSGPFIEALGGKVLGVGFGDINAAGLKNFRGQASSLVLAENSLITQVNLDCTVGWVRLNVPIDSGLVFRQQESITVFKRKMDVAILKLKEFGVLDRWAAAGLPASKCIEDGSLESNAMKFSNLSGVFVIAGSFSGFLVLFSVVKFYIMEQRSKTKKLLLNESTPSAAGPSTEEEHEQKKLQNGSTPPNGEHKYKETPVELYSSK